MQTIHTGKEWNPVHDSKKQMATNEEINFEEKPLEEANDRKMGEFWND